MENAGNIERSFGLRVRQERRARKWSQEDLAAQVAEQGEPLHYSAFSKIEAGTRRIVLNEAYAIAAAFGVPLTFLMTSGEPSETARQLAAAEAELAKAIPAADDAFARVAMLLNRITELRAALISEQTGNTAEED